MRRAMWVGLVLHALAGCDRSSTYVDASSDPAPDAERSDAGISALDAAPDAEAPDAAPFGDMSLTLTSAFSGSPADIPVVFGDASGALLATETTDSDGKVVRAVTGGDTVTFAFVAFPNDRRLVTYVGVQPGDALTYPLPFQALFFDPVVGTVTLDITSAYGGASDHVLHYCGATTAITPPQQIPLTIRQSCVQDGQLKLEGKARDGAGLAIGFATVEMAYTGGDENATLPAWAAAQAVDLTVAAVPAAADQLAIAFETSSATADPSGADLAFVFGVPDELTAVPYHVDLTFPTDDGRAVQSRIDDTATVAATVTLDGARILPALGAITISDGATARPTIHWQAASTLDPADGGTLYLSWSDGTTSTTWAFVLPPASSVTVPELPESLADWRPASDASVSWLEYSAELSGGTYATYRAAFPSVPYARVTTIGSN